MLIVIASSILPLSIAFSLAADALQNSDIVHLLAAHMCFVSPVRAGHFYRVPALSRTNWLSAAFALCTELSRSSSDAPSCLLGTPSTALFRCSNATVMILGGLFPAFLRVASMEKCHCFSM
jgi:hypothetical protein